MRRGREGGLQATPSSFFRCRLQSASSIRTERWGLVGCTPLLAPHPAQDQLWGVFGRTEGGGGCQTGGCGAPGALFTGKELRSATPSPAFLGKERKTSHRCPNPPVWWVPRVSPGSSRGAGSGQFASRRLHLHPGGVGTDPAAHVPPVPALSTGCTAAAPPPAGPRGTAWPPWAWAA